MSTANVRVTLTLMDRMTPELRRIRRRFLTPIGRRVPPKGSIARQMLELQVQLRRAGRALWAALPGGTAVPYLEAAQRLYHWAVIGGIVLYIVMAGILVLHWLSA